MPDFSPLSRQLNTDSWPKRALCYFFPALLPYTPQKQSVLPASLHLSFLSLCPPESLKPWAIFWACPPCPGTPALPPFYRGMFFDSPSHVRPPWPRRRGCCLAVVLSSASSHSRVCTWCSHLFLSLWRTPPPPPLISDSEPRSVVVQCRISGPLPGWFLTVF